MSKENLKLVVFALEMDKVVYEYGIPIEQVHEITRPGSVANCQERRRLSKVL